ncbi:hypothetical protein [Chryseobacterium ginsenosidimutans]|uniref:hypothetical protein n=1 Tax=Chryseobacterium ginsenosidimutans TaxID=687846 RepID=UPI0031CDC350
MKNIILFIILFTAFFSCKSKAQQPIDTLNYVKQFEINKADYVNKPFSYLLNQMAQIQPKTVWSIPVKNKRNIVRSTGFLFCKMNQSFYNAINLYITWQDNIPYSQTQLLGEQNGYYFTNDEKLLYGNKIIKDIRVYRR